MDILEKIFGSVGKVRIMRLFIFNPNISFDMDKVIARTKISPQSARLNIRALTDAGLIKPRMFTKEEKVEVKKPSKKKGKKGKKEKGVSKKIVVKKRVKGWFLNDSFAYLNGLQRLLIQVSPLQDQMIVRKFNRTGKIKLLIIAGVFTQEKDSRVDILIVGDNMRRSAVDSAIKDVEAELGKDLTYSFFETKDFQYRLGMYDKLIRDILDYPHKTLVNRLGLQEKLPGETSRQG